MISYGPQIDQEGLPAYWGIETFNSSSNRSSVVADQEGLPAYWGIETWPIRRAISLCKRIIRKDYLTTEVLKCLLVDGNTEMTSKTFWIAAKTLPR